MDNKFEFPKITSEQFRFNMGPWLTEKSEFGLKALVELRKDLLKVEAKIDKETLQCIHSDLSWAFHYISKIYSFSLGSSWDTSDSGLLFDKLDDGFEELKVKYGVLNKTKKQKQEEKRQKQKKEKDVFFFKLNEYLEMEQYPGRSLLQELFESNLNIINEQTINGRLLSKIEQDLYRTANSEITWETFILEAKDTIKYLEKPK